MTDDSNLLGDDIQLFRHLVTDVLKRCLVVWAQFFIIGQVMNDLVPG